jgi:hypothetical protein
MKAALDKRCRKCDGQVWYVFRHCSPTRPIGRTQHYQSAEIDDGQHQTG